jgi:hypothetical protein
VLHRGRERQFLAILQKWLAPQLRPAVPTIVHEPLELAIRDLVAINPVVRQTNGGGCSRPVRRSLDLRLAIVIRTIPGGTWLSATSLK